MSTKISVTINGIQLEVEPGKTILEAANEAGMIIPTLCYHKDLCIAGNCRVCVVEVTGQKRLAAACATPCEEEMEILTNSLKVRNSRKHIIELLLSEHNADCTKCYKNGNCELQELASEYKIMTQDFLRLAPLKNYTIDQFSPSIIKDDSKCIRCQRCVRTCAELQGVNALTVAYKGDEMKIATFFEKAMNDVVCTNCGQCVNHCPTGALVERNYIEEVWDAIADPDKHVVVQTAPAVRVGLGEELGLEAGERVTGRMVSSLKRLGFNSVLDTDFTADLTIIEEGTELLHRLKKALAEEDQSVKLPMATSCSPGWIKYIEHMYPELLDNLSSCKSPQQMFGALAKTYYAKARKIDPDKIISVSIMPCTAKKFEADRPEMHDSGFRDVDYVLTTRELAIMIKQAGIDFKKLPDAKFDRLMGESTGAAVLFGATGGVMEAALRTAYELVTGREVPFENLDITPVRGMEGVKEASVLIEKPLDEWAFLDGIELKCAVAHGLVNAKKVMDAVKEGTSDYHFIEIMACPGGCLGGGGQPIPTNPEIRQKRAEAIYAEDGDMPLRKSHENPEVLKIYQDFLGQPLGEKSHHLLHTKYTGRNRF
ncbi:NADH-dependent [FeFe] hydrogenase, group A6 [Sunxiuqinia elliptica]|uniref:NADH-quinone oxidoreductase subunit G/[NiFe] hydrogenase diaphorase moiety small subunit/NADP-reducing hydrogenase subunit HndD n=1 Tax=Sunxiuqinia elliptica TaxID=655355 RepID=A0A4R6GM93_9BACT|nr:NADH-dependent [FeFe] hydrogenase, group A6 [Sunxiuqinia elliptica]TDN96311.1 NADH-quinone oxidoreductase subunit G/[NiFe] hydrogenase diaphorase moiety small subunit/NADP-reducing hydrogenase subunit HndD [Sunxiuqinia elliptica]TDO68022.1 NADH-quinone oxidoreductase subunit G/[NiFe] hydrogenase diaphorase moiety small subunit/NADP-reducing hydrogenase subunit HndD [Sunxiuqinia elliptica]